MKRPINRHFLLIIFSLTLLGCGKSLFAPFTINKPGFNPELALERAEYLYLSGNTEDAEKLYLDLKEKYENDTENTGIYYGAVRGCSKCILEKGTADSTEVLKSFLNFALSLDTETFEAGSDKIAVFNQYAAEFKSLVWESFTLLLIIPDTARSEADYANMSISGLFSVCVSFVRLMTNTADNTSTIMAKLSEMSGKVEEFTQTWTEAESLNTNPADFLSVYKSALKALAESINLLYSEILEALSDATAIMAAVKTEGIDVRQETIKAKNVLSASLNEVFTVIIGIVDGTLDAMNELEAEAGDFYDNLNTALATF